MRTKSASHASAFYSKIPSCTPNISEIRNTHQSLSPTAELQPCPTLQVKTILDSSRSAQLNIDLYNDANHNTNVQNGNASPVADKFDNLAALKKARIEKERLQNTVTRQRDLIGKLISVIIEDILKTHDSVPGIIPSINDPNMINDVENLLNFTNKLNNDNVVKPVSSVPSCTSSGRTCRLGSSNDSISDTKRRRTRTLTNEKRRMCKRLRHEKRASPPSLFKPVARKRYSVDTDTSSSFEDTEISEICENIKRAKQQEEIRFNSLQGKVIDLIEGQNSQLNSIRREFTYQLNSLKDDIDFSNPDLNLQKESSKKNKKIDNHSPKSESSSSGKINKADSDWVPSVAASSSSYGDITSSVSMESSLNGRMMRSKRVNNNGVPWALRDRSKKKRNRHAVKSKQTPHSYSFDDTVKETSQKIDQMVSLWNRMLEDAQPRNRNNGLWLPPNTITNSSASYAITSEDDVESSASKVGGNVQSGWCENGFILPKRKKPPSGASDPTFLLNRFLGVTSAQTYHDVTANNDAQVDENNNTIERPFIVKQSKIKTEETESELNTNKNNDAKESLSPPALENDQFDEFDALPLTSSPRENFHDGVVDHVVELPPCDSPSSLHISEDHVVKEDKTDNAELFVSNVRSLKQESLTDGESTETCRHDKYDVIDGKANLAKFQPLNKVKDKVSLSCANSPQNYDQRDSTPALTFNRSKINKSTSESSSQTEIFSEISTKTEKLESNFDCNLNILLKKKKSKSTTSRNRRRKNKKETETDIVEWGLVKRKAMSKAKRRISKQLRPQKTNSEKTNEKYQSLDGSSDLPTDESSAEFSDISSDDNYDVIGSAKSEDGLQSTSWSKLKLRRQSGAP